MLCFKQVATSLRPQIKKQEHQQLINVVDVLIKTGITMGQSKRKGVAMGQSKEIVLELKDIHKSFSGVAVLTGIRFQLTAGKVHVLVGENGAGKSTLMKIISGIHAPDQGEIIINGKTTTGLTPQKSIDLGISMIHQELNPEPYMTIADNIFLGREICGRIPGFVDKRKMNAECVQILERMEIPFRPDTVMMDLSMAGKQLIEIAKAVSRNSNIIIMDEPTSSLTETEVRILFKQIEELKARNVAIIYITHKMDEIFRLADDITVLRDGIMVATGGRETFTMDSLITKMVGREISAIYPKYQVPIGDVIFEAKGLTRRKVFDDISFSVRRGEILGLAGLVGAGRTEVARAVFGLDKLDAGEVFLDHARVDTSSPTSAIAAGIAMVSEDRKDVGLIPCRSIRENISLVTLDKCKSHGFLNLKQELKMTTAMIKKMSIKVSTQENMVVSLSGGNQQKVVLSKWLLGKIRLLILDEPTRGIDVGAKAEIHRMMCDLAAEGMAIIMISSELPEILGMSDRVIVMHNGKITGELNRDQATQESIMRYAVAET